MLQKLMHGLHWFSLVQLNISGQSWYLRSHPLELKTAGFLLSQLGSHADDVVNTQYRRRSAPSTGHVEHLPPSLPPSLCIYIHLILEPIPSF
jgi:hypothetical protein